MTSQSLMSKLHRRTFLRSIALTALLAIGAGALVQSPAIAHQQKAAITRIIFNERTGTVEVVHRFFLHDAEHAVRQVLDRNADIIGSATTRQQFADYVEQNFVMHNQRGAEIPLQSVGHEIDGNRRRGEDAEFLWGDRNVVGGFVKRGRRIFNFGRGRESRQDEGNGCNSLKGSINFTRFLRIDERRYREQNWQIDLAAVVRL